MRIKQILFILNQNMKKIILIILIFVLGFLSGILIYPIFFIPQKENVITKKQSAKKEQKINISPTDKISVTLPPSYSPINENGNQNNNSLPIININYQPRPDWETYKDNVAGFSFQYQNNPDEYNSYEKINDYEYGKSVNIYSCFTPKQGPSAGQTVCSVFYQIKIYNNYDGGSRRVWFKNNINSFNQCNLPIYYADVYLSNIKGLLITSECGSSWGSGYFIFSKGKLMIVIKKDYFFFDSTAKKIKIDDYFYQRLATFKFD